MYSYYQTIYKLLSKCVDKENQSGKRGFSGRSLWLAVDCVAQDTQNLLLLPPDYRVTYSPIQGNLLAIGHASGFRVAIKPPRQSKFRASNGSYLKCKKSRPPSE